jgi:hypothetical protein
MSPLEAVKIMENMNKHGGLAAGSPGWGCSPPELFEETALSQ